MASLDFVLDLVEKIESQDIDYYLIVSQKTKTGHRCDIFHNFKEKDSAQAVVEINEQAIMDVVQKYGIEIKKKSDKKKNNKKKKGEK